MTAFRFSSSAALVLLFSCGAVPSQRPGASGLTGTRFDIDINGNILIVNSEKNTLHQLSSQLTLIKQIGGTGWGDDQFDQPEGIWARNGIDVFVADYGNHRIQRFDRNLAFVSSFSTRERPNPGERFGYPTDVAVSRLGDLFICDSENSRVLKVVGLSKIERSFGGFDAGKGRLYRPSQLEIGPNDNVYVLDGQRVVEFDNFGNFVRVLGEGLFKGAPRIFADENGLVVLDDEAMIFFDQSDRLVVDIRRTSLLDGAEVAINDFAFTRGNGYLLTAEGIQSIPDRRVTQTEAPK